MSKQFGDYLEREGRSYRVRVEFTRVSLDNFLRHVTQRRGVYSHYIRAKYEQLVMYEFLLPLTREGELRSALDELFYYDTITRRLREIGLSNLEGIVPRDDGLNDEEYIDTVCSMAADRFVGYSITLVSGRYRAEALMSRQKAGESSAQEQRYLIDETTALVRFIIKVNTSKSYYEHDVKSILDAINSDHDPQADTDAFNDEVKLIRAFFFLLFAEAVVRTIDGEDEIWLLESGPQHRLYVWERTR